MVDRLTRALSVKSQKYAPWLDYWVSEKDRGQSHAINKGMEKATGAWGNWLNSDDVLLENALAKVGLATKTAPAGTDGVCLGCRVVSSDRSRLINRFTATPVHGVYAFLNGGLQPMAQPAKFRLVPGFRVERNDPTMPWTGYCTSL